MEISYTRNDKIISRKFYQYLIPTVMMVMMMQFGSLADGIVVGNFIGEAALSATSLALPVVFLSQLPAIAIATGGSIVLASLIAKREVEAASKVFKLTVFFAFLLSLIFVPVGIFASDGIATLLVGNFPELQSLVAEYTRAYLLQAPLMGIGISVCYLLPSDNHPNLGAVYFIIANVAHIGSEILFALYLPDGYRLLGAGFSMGIGMVFGLLVLIPYLKSKNRLVHFSVSHKGMFKFLPDILKSGSAMAATTFLFGVNALVLNIAATTYLVDATEMSLLAMLSNFVFVMDLFITGVLQIMPSVVSALYGEKDYYGGKAVVKKVVLITLIITAALTLIAMFFPQLFFAIFGVDLSGMEASFATMGLLSPLTIVRIYCIGFFFYAANKFLLQYFPSIFINSIPLINTIVKNGALGPVLNFVAIMVFRIVGYGWANPVIEGGAFLLTIVIVFIAKRMGKFANTDALLLPKSDVGEEYLDISLPADKAQISQASKALQEYAYSICKDETSAGLLAVASEEIIANIIAYGYKHQRKNTYIDVRLTKVDDCLIVRIRDDGVSFNPTTYQSNEEDFEYHGIEIIKKFAKSFQYLRVLNTNNTIMEIPTSR